MEMTKDTLKKICRKDGLYGLPSLNDKIYLHYKGFSKIENLEEYKSLKALWLEGNGLTKIEGLESLTNLRTLFLHENVIYNIEGLDNLIELDSINLSKNFIKKIENLGNLKKLTGLNLAHNSLTSYESIQQVLEAPTIQTLDLQNNKINDPKVVDLFEKLEDLRVLYLQGNPVVKLIPYYRKTIISKCKMLKYLDDRPIFDEERRRVNAWSEAFTLHGLEAANEAERKEISAIKKEKDDQDLRNMEYFESIMKEGIAKRQLKENNMNESNLEKEVRNGESLDINPFSQEKIQIFPESENLKALRENRWEKNISEIKNNDVKINIPIDTLDINHNPQIETTENNLSGGKSWNKICIQVDDEEAVADKVNDNIDIEITSPSDNRLSNNKFTSLLKEASIEVYNEIKTTNVNSSDLGSQSIDFESLD